MSKEDLSYHIEYPSSVTPKELIAKGENDDFGLRVSDMEKIPVVVLFGWVGCKDKHLVKYGSIYEDLGFITMRCTVALSVLAIRHDKLPRLAKRFLGLLHENSLDDHPIIFHIFSNGGSVFYQYVGLEMQKPNKMLKIKGVIFDSAPGGKRFDALYRAVMPSIPQNRPAWYKATIAFIITLVLMAYYIIQPYVTALFKLKKPQTEAIVLDEEHVNWPELFIYSKTDDVCRCEDIEKFARRREEKSIQVTRLCLEDSPHVQHFIKHREVYTKTVVNFIESCFNRKNRMQGWL